MARRRRRDQPCLQAAGFDPEVLRAWTGGGIAYADKKMGDARRLARLKASLEKDLKKAKLDPADLEAGQGLP